MGSPATSMLQLAGRRRRRYCLPTLNIEGEREKGRNDRWMMPCQQIRRHNSLNLICSKLGVFSEEIIHGLECSQVQLVRQLYRQMLPILHYVLASHMKTLKARLKS